MTLNSERVNNNVGIPLVHPIRHSKFGLAALRVDKSVYICENIPKVFVGRMSGFRKTFGTFLPIFV
jgi:hypothetical protein